MFAQENIEKHVQAMPNDSIKVDYLIGLVDSLRDRNSPQALLFANIGKNVAMGLGYTRGIFHMLETIGWTHYRNNDLLNAFEATEQALVFAYKLKDNNAIAKCTITLAAIYFQQQRFDKAIDNFKKAARLSKQAGNLTTYSRSLGNVGFGFIQLQHYDSAFYYTTQAELVAKQLGEDYIRGFCIRNFGEIATGRQQYQQAINVYKEGLALATSSANNYLKISILYRLGGVYNLLKQPKLAMPFLQEAIQLGENFDYNDELERALKLMAESYMLQNDYSKAYQVQNKYIHLHDSLEIFKREQQVSIAQTKFDSELKQTQIELLTREAASQQKSFESQRWLAGSSIVFALVLFVLLILLWKKNERITAAKKIEEVKNDEIREQTLLLKASNVTKDKLFSIISHDLRSPIGGLKSLLELVNRNGISQSEFVQISQSLRRNIDSVYDDLDNLLLWSQTQLNGIKLQRVNFSLLELVQSKLHLFEESAKAKGVILHTDFQDDIHLFADKNQLGLVLRNLLSNAIKFSSGGTTIKVQVKGEGDIVRIEVKDEGVGISQQDLGKLFNHETHFTKRGTQNEKGIGLGLMLTKEFVEANGGSLSVQSELGKGSTFTILLKRTQV